MAIRYGAWRGGPDPLEPPYDIRRALDEIGSDVLAGMSPRAALQRLMRSGVDGRSGLDALRRQARNRARELRRSNRLDGTLEQIRRLLDEALESERAALFPEPSDSARMAEAELDSLPSETARAVRQLADYQWRSAAGAATYQQINDMLRSEVLDAQFAGLKQALTNPDPQALQQIRDMLDDLNAMLDADARGEHTAEQFQQFMAKHGQFFPDDPANLSELVDSLARRSAAAERLMNSLTDDQRQELSELMGQALGQAGLGDQLSRLQRSLRAARPDLNWGGSERMDGEGEMGYADGTAALGELADLDELAELSLQDYPGASLADIDEELVERALGQQAVQDLQHLRAIERELQRQGYLEQGGGRGLELSPRALRRLGATALRTVFAALQNTRRGDHEVRNAGAAGEITGASRQWQFGDEQPLDVVRTVRNAVLRSAGSASAEVRLAAEDFEVVETERRSSAAVALLVDMSYSMELRGTWGEAKTTALALHSLVQTKFPQDAIEIIGFSDYARVMSPRDLVNHEWERVYGTNLQHALMLARRHLDKHRTAEPIILVITDGEPTAHLAPDGFSDFCWPPSMETVAATLAEVERCTRRGATINIFMLDNEQRLVDFMQEVGRRNGGRVFLPGSGTLGEYVVSDYLSARGGRRRRAG
ncbi:MAG TPA: VWA domain-containing protein [Jatrophihabitans sp.]|nr:VWA domain-containing protein [Jatrophihabitans sp.]